MMMNFRMKIWFFYASELKKANHWLTIKRMRYSQKFRIQKVSELVQKTLNEKQDIQRMNINLNHLYNGNHGILSAISKDKIGNYIIDFYGLISLLDSIKSSIDKIKVGNRVEFADMYDLHIKKIEVVRQKVDALSTKLSYSLESMREEINLPLIF
jgi:hypothetical protein